MSNDTKALKSGVWYTVANFIMKGIGFLTTPIFTRILSKADVGYYSDYTSVLSVFTILMTLGIGTTFIRAKFDYKDEFDDYISSSLVLSSVVTLIWGTLICLFSSLFSSITKVEPKYLYIMVVYLFMYSAVDIYQAKERHLFGYKRSVFISLLVAVSTALLSVLLVNYLDNKLDGRVLGSAIPTVAVGAILYISIISKGKHIKVSYWKYALPICIPYIPHILSMTLLNSMDKIMITNICGAEDNALYSVAYTCGAIITMLATSINTAFAPWLGEKLNEKKHDEIYNVSIKYVGLFAIATCGVMLITPEILLIMGGKNYSEAIYVMPPVALGCVCQFVYSMYVSVEQFNKKTTGMAIASAVAALSNYVLNSIYIPKYGYIAAAYTTLASYLILLVIHVLLVHRMGMGNVYPLKKISIILLVLLVYMILVNLLYQVMVVRYILVVAYAAACLWFVNKNKKNIIALFKRGKE